MKRALLATVCLLMLVALPAAGQGREEAGGSADFRQAPILAPGTYSDAIVAGESVWYGVLYTNHTTLTVRTSLEDGDLDQGDLTLKASLFTPDLIEIGSGERTSFSTNPDETYYGEKRSSDTNLWFVRVSLDTTGRRGILHTLELDIKGALSSGFEGCDGDCEVRQRMESSQSELEELEALVASPDLLDPEFVQTRIAEFEEAEAAAAQEERQALDSIAELCSPAESCDELPGPSSRLWMWAVGAVVAVGGGGLLVLRWKR